MKDILPQILMRVPSLSFTVLLLVALFGARRAEQRSYHSFFLLGSCGFSLATALFYGVVFPYAFARSWITTRNYGPALAAAEVLLSPGGAMVSLGIVAWAIETRWPRPRQEPVWRMLLLSLISGGTYAAYWTLKRSIQLLRSAAGRASALGVAAAVAIYSTIQLVAFFERGALGEATPGLVLAARVLLAVALLVNSLALRSAFNAEVAAHQAAHPEVAGYYRCELFGTVLLGPLYVQHKLNGWWPPAPAAASDAGVETA